jgi:hypothetical protein
MRDPEDQGECEVGMFIAEEINGVGAKGSPVTTMVNVETSLEAIEPETSLLGTILWNC